MKAELQPRSLRARLSRLFALQTLLGLSGVCGAVYLVIALTLAQRQDDTLALKRDAVQRLLAEGEAGGRHDAASLQHLLGEFLAGHEELSLLVTGARGQRVIVHAAGRPPGATAKRLVFDVALPASLGGRGRAELVLDPRADATLLRRLAWTLLVAALAGSAAVSLTGHQLLRRGLAPLGALARQTAALDARVLERRLDPAGQPSEVLPLVQQFNALLDRLQSAYAQLEAFNADVAHELNNPLAILIGSGEVALRRPRSAAELHELLGSNLEELRRMAGIVADMLFLSQAERGVAARRSAPGSLAALAAEVLAYHEAALDDAGLTVEVSGDAQAAVDRGLVRRALSNLLGNATRYAARGTVVTLHIGRRGGQAFIGVHNVGKPIAPEHLPRLFDRFYRVDPARANADRNHGLGLAIVAAIARLHGGEATAESTVGSTLIAFTLADDEAGNPPVALR